MRGLGEFTRAIRSLPMRSWRKQRWELISTNNLGGDEGQGQGDEASAPPQAISGSKKPSRWDREGSGNCSQLLCPDDVSCLKAFGAFEQVELHGFTFIQRSVAVLLDCGEVDEHIFPRGALDESISLRPVEPLHCTFLSHG